MVERLKIRRNYLRITQIEFFTLSKLVVLFVWKYETSARNEKKYQFLLVSIVAIYFYVFNHSRFSDFSYWTLSSLKACLLACGPCGPRKMATKEPCGFILAGRTELIKNGFMFQFIIREIFYIILNVWICFLAHNNLFCKRQVQT